jgi:thiosulfate dehydrogenase [quinone] large subunit
LKTLDAVLASLTAGGFSLLYYSADKLHLTTTEGKAFSVLAVLVILGAVATYVYDKLVANPVEGGATELPQPAIARFLFHDTRSAALWLVVRFYVGFAWLEGGLHKVVDEQWSYGNGSAILGYWKGAVAIPAQGAPKINEEYGWYRDFLTLLIDGNAHTWFAPMIAWGELLVGVGLIVGGLVGIAAFFGALMNMSFMLAGTTSTNPVLFFLAVALMLGWQVAGYYGADRFILPLIGAPWKPDKLFSRSGSPSRRRPRRPPCRHREPDAGAPGILARWAGALVALVRRARESLAVSSPRPPTNTRGRRSSLGVAAWSQRAAAPGRRGVG